VNLTGSKHDLLTMHFAGVQGSSGFRFIDSVVINWQRQSRGLDWSRGSRLGTRVDFMNM